MSVTGKPPGDSGESNSGDIDPDQAISVMTDGEPGSTNINREPGSGLTGLLRSRSNKSLDQIDGFSLETLQKQYPKHLARAFHTLTSSAPGEVWIDLLFGGVGWITDLVKSFVGKRKGSGLDREPGEPGNGDMNAE